METKNLALAAIPRTALNRRTRTFALSRQQWYLQCFHMRKVALIQKKKNDRLHFSIARCKPGLRVAIEPRFGTRTVLPFVIFHRASKAEKLEWRSRLSTSLPRSPALGSATVSTGGDPLYVIPTLFRQGLFSGEPATSVRQEEEKQKRKEKKTQEAPKGGGWKAEGGARSPS